MIPNQQQNSCEGLFAFIKKKTVVHTIPQKVRRSSCLYAAAYALPEDEIMSASSELNSDACESCSSVRCMR